MPMKRKLKKVHEHYNQSYLRESEGTVPVMLWKHSGGIALSR